MKDCRQVENGGAFICGHKCAEDRYVITQNSKNSRLTALVRCLRLRGLGLDIVVFCSRLQIKKTSRSPLK